ncbi:MAG TPA: hypothetical protein PKC98_10675, partial [Candidatus Melainabacteria bacterium]|nr:hypothetical protein [Candidatus Melainabacteria bacterium]
MQKSEIAPESAAPERQTQTDSNAAGSTAAFNDSYEPPPSEKSSTSTNTVGGDQQNRNETTTLEGNKESDLFSSAYSNFSPDDMSALKSMRKSGSDSSADPSMKDFELDKFQIVDAGNPGPGVPMDGLNIPDKPESIPTKQAEIQKFNIMTAGALDTKDQEGIGRDYDIPPPLSIGGADKKSTLSKAGGDLDFAAPQMDSPPPIAGDSTLDTTRETQATSELAGLSDQEITDRIAKLDSDSYRERERARKELVEAPNKEEVLERLQQTYDDPVSLEQQMQAQRAIQEMGGKVDKNRQGEPLSKEQIKELIGDLDSDKFQERENARNKLSKAGNPEEVMQQLTEAMGQENSPVTPELAASIATGLGASAKPEQLQGLYDTMNGGELSEQAKGLYEAAVNGGLAKADRPVTFKDSQGRLSGMYEGSLDNPILTATYNEAGQVEQGFARGTTFSRQEDGSYLRSDGFKAEDVTVTESGLRFKSEGSSGSIEWRPNGDSSFYDESGKWNSTVTRDGR